MAQFKDYAIFFTIFFPTVFVFKWFWQRQIGREDDILIVVISAGVFAGLAYGAITWTWSRLFGAEWIKRSGKQTQGTIISITSTKKDSLSPSGMPGRTYWESAIVYEFEASEQRWTGAKTVRGNMVNKRTGEGVKVYYLEENPSENAMEI